MVTLTRNADSSWTVDGEYAANQPVVEDLLETLHTMRILKQVNRKAIPNTIKDLAARAIKWRCTNGCHSSTGSAAGCACSPTRS